MGQETSKVLLEQIHSHGKINKTTGKPETAELVNFYRGLEEIAKSKLGRNNPNQHRKKKKTKNADKHVNTEEDFWDISELIRNSLVWISNISEKKTVQLRGGKMKCKQV